MTEIEKSVRKLSKDVQANVLRTPKYADGATRNWSIYLFFRVLKQSESDAFMNSLERRSETTSDAQTGDTSLQDLILFPELVHTTDADPKSEKAPAQKPSHAFFDWLQLLLNGNNSNIFKAIEEKFDWPAKKVRLSKERTVNLQKRLGPTAYQKNAQFGLQDLFARATSALDDGYAIEDILNLVRNTSFGSSFNEAGQSALRGGLIRLLVFELLRQFGAQSELEFLGDKVEKLESHSNGFGLVRSELAEFALREDLKTRSEGGVTTKDAAGPSLDPAPISIGFTAPGLEFIGLSTELVNTFPDAFKEGMAARAHLLSDTGSSAPENWDGELGQKSIHGVLNSGFAVSGVEERYWRTLREQIKAFNRNGVQDQALRFQIGSLFRLTGIELMHIELGQDPYPADVQNPDNYIPTPPKERTEHFGFRDGLSQPFVDMGLAVPPPGGGNPGRLQSWEPIEPGEIFLGLPNQDAHKAIEPAEPSLRFGGTYMVFRKLKQDVIGFRNFLESTYPNSPTRQRRLSAEMVGRWPNGSSLVQAPTAPIEFEENLINNFRFAQDDPDGIKCPLGAHIRRSNPRDIGRRDSVKRHRILRRSIGYGGPFLEANSTQKQDEKGLLFVAINAQIDLQFELIQSRWLNSGEFLGQVGLEKCPLIGANSGQASDKFFEVGAVSPVRGLPRFVITRGGDYFFMPSLTALTKIANREYACWHGDSSPETPFGGHTAGDPRTPTLFGADRLKAFSRRVTTDPNTTHLVVSPPNMDAGPQSDTDTIVFDDSEAQKEIVFVARYDDVAEVLKGDAGPDGKVKFSAAHYLEAGKHLTRGGKVLLGTDFHNKDTATARKNMKNILRKAWQHLNDNGTPDQSMDNWVTSIADKRCDKTLARVSQAGRIDLVQDLAAGVAYDIVGEIFGVPGPSWLTELALALPFAKRHVGEVHPDWLAMLSGKKNPSNTGLATMQIWSTVSLLALVANFDMNRDLVKLSRQAGSELINHIDGIVEDAKLRRPLKPRHLVDSFIALEKTFVTSRLSSETYYEHVRLLLAELIAGTLALMPWTFGTMMQAILKHRINLSQLVPILADTAAGKANQGLERLIYEINRVNPGVGLLMRRCEQTTNVNGIKIMEGQWVAAILATAGLDKTAFPRAKEFSLDPILPGAPRDISKYLMFGSRAAEHQCWGREKIAMIAFKRMIIATSKLNGLRPVAGPAGDPTLLLGAIIGLYGHFPPFRYYPNPAPVI